MIDRKISITASLAAALMLTTSVTAFAVPDDGSRPVPEITVPDTLVENGVPGVVGEEVAVTQPEDVEEDEDLDGEDDDDDEDDDDVADDDDDAEDEEDGDDIADGEDDEEDEEEDAEADEDDDADEEDVSGEVGEDETDEIAGVDEEAGGPDAADTGGRVYQIVALWDCNSETCGRLILGDDAGNVTYSNNVYFAPEFLEDTTPQERTFAHVHVGCRIRGYFQPVEGDNGETRYGFYVQEFL